MPAGTLTLPRHAELSEREEPSVLAVQQQEQMRNQIRTQCFDVLSDAVQDKESAMSFKDLNDYMKGLDDSALKGAKTHEEKMEWLENLIEGARSFARETIDVGARTLREIRQAKADDVSDASIERWRKRLKERPHGEEWTQARTNIEAFLDQKLPSLRREWAQLRSDLKEIEALKSALGVTGRDMKELAALETADFRNAKFPVRRKRVNAAMNALRAHQKNWKKRPGKETEGSRFYAETRSFLLTAVAEGSLAKTKVGMLLKKIFSGRALPQAKAYFRGTIRGYRKEWQRDRARYDALHEEMRDTGQPRGFSPCTPEAFLEKTYPQRLAYLTMLTARLHPEGKPASALCCRIWHAFDAEDWYDAERLIGILEAAFPSHRDIGPMVRYLESHRDDAEGQEEPAKQLSNQDIVADANRLLRRYPEIRILLGESMRKDSANPQDQNARTRLVGRMMYNLVWAEQRGYTSEEEQLQDMHSDHYKKQTREYIKRGHGNALEKNMMWGDTADENAIREDCTAAQMITMTSDPAVQHAVCAKVDKLKDNERFGYWSDLKVAGMPLSRHHYFVHHDSKRLKWLMWQMRDRGIPFTPESDDDVSPRNGREPG